MMKLGLRKFSLAGKKLYTVHYTMLGRLVYHLCKLETHQLKNMLDNVINLSKIKRKTKQKALPKPKKRKKMTKAEKKKFLARINKGRVKAGLKPIRAKR